MPLVMNQSLYYEIDEKVSIKDIIKCLAKNDYQKILTHSEYERFAKDHMPVSNNAVRELLSKLYYQDCKRHFDKRVFEDLCKN